MPTGGHFAPGYLASGLFADGYFGLSAPSSGAAGAHFAPGLFGLGYFAPGYFADIAAGPAPGEAADLFEALVAFGLASAPLATAFGRADWLWADEAPAGTPLPYAVLAELADEPEFESGGASLERSTLELSVFAAGKSAARALRRALAAALTDPTLAFAAGTLLHLRPQPRHGELDPERGPGGCDVWRETLDLEAVVGH